MKIFYNPKTLKIIGASDGENSLDFPFVESEESFHSLENLKISKDKKGFSLKKIENDINKSIQIIKERGKNKLNKL